jgi:acetyl/propionyl-CoA carboxylase alpha subunit
MGDKIQSKKLAAKAGVSTIPGHNEAIENASWRSRSPGRSATR